MFSTVLAIAGHTLKTNLRNLKSTAVMFVLPIVFMGIFGLAFGGESAVKLKVGVVQEVRESLDVAKILDESVGDGLELSAVSIDDESELRAQIADEELDAGVLVDGASPDPADYSYDILVPDGSPSAAIDQAVLTQILTQVRYGEDAAIPVNILDPEQDTLTGFDYLAPGLMVYGLIILIPGIAGDFVRISERRQIFRYANSRVRAGEIIAGHTLYYGLVGLAQTVLLYSVARGFGYQATGNVGLVLLPAILVLLFVIATGLLIGAAFKKTEPATNTGTIISIVLGFFSGSFIQGIGALWEFELGGRTVSFNEVLPTTWGTQAFEQILTRGRGLGDVRMELGVLLVSGVVTLAIGTLVYGRRQLRLRG